MKPLAFVLSLLLAGPAVAQDYPPMRREISNETVVYIGAAAMVGAAWLAYDAGDDAAESRRNLWTIGAAYALWGGALLINSSRQKKNFALLPVERGAMVHAQLRFGGRSQP